ncbi:MAG TPA: polysaccharide biosynthesis/export family protein, partial [Chthoniobacteraceae bacterium]|nr:polysaccharide biosynthesis/export family protein [Chthoniobacteraceae bacterium]
MRFRFSLIPALLLAFSSALAQPENLDGVPVMPALPVTAEASPAPTPQPVFYTSIASLDDKRKLEVGDHVSYRVIEDKNPAVDLIVTDSGDMDVPLLGRVAAAGKTCRQLALDMKPVLEKTYFYKATVIVALDLATQKSPGRI